MATFVTATCSECFAQQVRELNPRRSELACEFCDHSVPMFEKRELEEIKSALTMERRKMFIALALFAGAVFLFGLYVAINSRDDLVVIPGAEGEERGLLIERDDASITIKDPVTDVERNRLYAEVLATQVEEVKSKHPLMTDEEAAERAGELHIGVEKGEPQGEPLLILAVLAGLGAIVLSAIATTDQLVCEF